MAYNIYIEKQGKPYPYDVEKTDGSLPKEPVVSTKMKPIEEKDANSEVERGEIILDPNTGALHKALGKPHSQGGTPVSLKNNSFIFSNFKDLAINKKEKEVFEFKMGGKYKPSNNTPSKVLEKEVDIAHHNKMIDILQNEKKYTKETVNSAKLMMLKNLEKVGQVAYLQENKKNSEIPQFAQQTAPVYSNDTDEEINQSIQYLQGGGTKLTAAEIALAEKNPLKDINGWTYMWKDGQKVYYKKSTSQTKYTGPMMGNDKWAAWLKTPQGQAYTAKQNQFGFTQENNSNFSLGPNFKFTPPKTVQLPVSTPGNEIWYQDPAKKETQITGNQAGNPKGIIDPTNQKSKLTPWQLINIGIPFARALNVKTQYPIRQHQESLIPQFENINVQPQLDQNNQSYFNASALTKAMNPMQGSQYAQQLFGNRLSANNQVIGNVQQANVQTQNNQKSLTASTLNADAAQNRQFDANYYNGVQAAVKNTRDLKEAYMDQGIDTTNNTITKKLAFDSWLNMQQQYRGKPTYVDSNGIQHYAGITPYSAKAGFFGNSVVHNPTNIDWSTYLSNGNKIDSAEELGSAYQKMLEYDPTLKLADFLKFRGINNYMTNSMNVPQQQKRGGMFRPKLRTRKSLY